MSWGAAQAGEGHAPCSGMTARGALQGKDRGDETAWGMCAGKEAGVGWGGRGQKHQAPPGASPILNIKAAP